MEKLTCKTSMIGNYQNNNPNWYPFTVLIIQITAIQQFTAPILRSVVESFIGINGTYVQLKSKSFI